MNRIDLKPYIEDMKKERWKRHKQELNYIDVLDAEGRIIEAQDHIRDALVKLSGDILSDVSGNLLDAYNVLSTTLDVMNRVANSYHPTKKMTREELLDKVKSDLNTISKKAGN